MPRTRALREISTGLRLPVPQGGLRKGCTAIAFEDGGKAVPAVWGPGDTRLDLKGQAIEYDGRVIELGEPVRGSGGDDPTAGFDVPEECSSRHYAVMGELQQGS